VRAEASTDIAKLAPRNASAIEFSKSDLWIIVGVIGLILAGMLLGAEITRLWISHAAPMAPHHLSMVPSFLTSMLFR